MRRSRQAPARYPSRERRRTGFIVFDMEDPSQLPRTTEPLFRAFKAHIEIFPVMDQADLQKGLQQLGGG